MNKIDTEQLKQQTDLRTMASRYSELTRASGDKELQGPCPKCAGEDRFHCQADWFMCRQCHPKRGDAIEFLQWMGLAHGFKEAAAMLSGNALPAATQPRRAPERAQAARQSPEWTTKAADLVQAAHEKLLNSDSEFGERGRQYLIGRGILPNTWQRFQLGIGNASLPGTKGKLWKSAIVIPWTQGGAVVAVRFRFLEKHTYTDSEGNERTEKQAALYDSQFRGHLFGGLGLLRCAEDIRTLIICEGEVNALSIWQLAHQTAVDVLSMGSESATLTPAMIAYARRFRRVVVWMDKADIARGLMDKIPRAYGVSSPAGQDANDLLQAGHLGGYLSKWRLDLVADNPQGQQALLWNLFDGQPLDAGSQQVLQAIAERLGIAL